MVGVGEAGREAQTGGREVSAAGVGCRAVWCRRAERAELPPRSLQEGKARGVFSSSTWGILAEGTCDQVIMLLCEMSYNF